MFHCRAAPLHAVDSHDSHRSLERQVTLLRKPKPTWVSHSKPSFLTPSCSAYGHSQPINKTQALTHPTDVRHHRRGPFQNPRNAKWREKSQAFDRPVGPAECAYLYGGHELQLTRLAVMDRDRRLTGFLRGQTDKVEAPPGFELNNPWRVSIPHLTEAKRTC